MKHTLKALGLALLAAFAMSVVAASAAQAESPGKFTVAAPAEYPAVGTGTEEGGTANNYFQITGSEGPKTHCESVTYEGTLEEASTSLTVTPHYTNCVTTTDLGPQTTTVDLNGCHYTFEAGTVTSATDTHGSVEIICPAGEEIEVTVAGICAVDVPPQTITGGVTFTNKESDVTVDVDITNKLTYTETDLSIIFCPNTNDHHTGDGSFVSEVTFECFEDLGTHAGVTKDPDGTERSKPTATEGSKIKCDVG